MADVPSQGNGNANESRAIRAEPAQPRRKGPILATVTVLAAIGVGTGIWLSTGTNEPPSATTTDSKPQYRSPASRSAYLHRVSLAVVAYSAEQLGRCPDSVLQLEPYLGSELRRTQEIVYRAPAERLSAVHADKTIVACDAPGRFGGKRWVGFADGHSAAMSPEEFTVALATPDNAAIRAKLEAITRLHNAVSRHSPKGGLLGTTSTICKTRLKAIGVGLAMYRTEYRRKPAPDLIALIEKGHVPAKTLLCPGSADDRGGYFYYPLATGRPDSIVACDKQDNHPGERNVLTLDGGVVGLTEAQFTEALARPHNATFAAALRAFEDR